MTEAEWLESADSWSMLSFVVGKASERKFRLYACADCRRVWPFFDRDPDGQRAIEVAERFADGEASELDLAGANQTPGLTRSIAYQTTVADASAGAWAVAYCIADAVTHCVDIEEAEATQQSEKRAQAVLVREIFGNPYRRTTIDSAWRTPSVLGLARSIYEERRLPEGTLDTGRLAILHDALLDAGCDNEELIAHCRSPGPHVRGCWAIDAILAKS